MKMLPYVRQFVARKYALDAALGARRSLPSDFENAWPEKWNRAWRTIDPITFMRTVWPFWEATEIPESQERRLCLVAPDVVMGASDKFRPENLSESAVARLFAATDAQVRNFVEAGNWASFCEGYGHVGAHPMAWELIPFGLIVVHEGKNRAAVFAKYKRPIAYEVRLNLYPPAQDLLLECLDGRFLLHWAGRGACELLYCADILVPLLKTYGVQEQRLGATGIPGPLRQG